MENNNLNISHNNLITKKKIEILNNLFQKAKQIDFYKKKYKNLDIPSEINNYDDWKKIPLIDKNDLSNYFSNISTRKPNSFSMYTYIDTYGEKYFLPMSYRDYLGMVEFEKLRFKKLNLKKGTKCLVFCFPLQHLIPTAQALIELGMDYYAIEGRDDKPTYQKIIDEKIEVIFTSAQSIDGLLSYVEKTKQKTNLKIINTGGQKIKNFEIYKEKIKRILGAEAIDMVGSSELQNFAIRDINDGLFYLLDENQFFEVLGENKKSNDGLLVITPFWRHDFPLIRYSTNDIVTDFQKGNRKNIWGSYSFKEIKKRIDFRKKLGGYMVLIDQVYDLFKSEINKNVSKNILLKFINKYLYDFAVVIKQKLGKDIIIIYYYSPLFISIFLNSKLERIVLSKYFIKPVFKKLSSKKFKTLFKKKIYDLR